MKQSKEKLVRTNIHVPPALWQAVRIAALEQRQTVQQFVTKALEAAVKGGK